MPGDFSRWTFQPWQHHAAVHLQQGRVLTDADWNEQAAAAQRRLQAGSLDSLGRAAVPLETPDAFRVRLAADGGLTIGLGRAYVDGLLVENHGDPRETWSPVLAELAGSAPVRYENQPHLPAPAPLPTTGTHLVYLKVWQREITALEDPSLVDPALGVDTTARLQTVWQVKVVPIDDTVHCGTPPESVPELRVAEPVAAGRLTVSSAETEDEPDPCLVTPKGGYTGLENQLYRVQIHREGPAGGASPATFVWSRDNATVAARVTQIPATLDRLVVDQLGPDEVLSLHDGDWVEILDDVHELAGEPGLLRRIQGGGGVDEATRTVLLTENLPGGTFPVDGARHPLHPVRVRRWDQHGRVVDADGDLVVDLDAAGADGAIPVPAPGTRIILEHGIAVELSLATSTGVFRTGDHWLVPARTADATAHERDRVPPAGIHAHVAPLALVTFPDRATDCRVVFPPLTGIDALAYVAGDGQEVTPNLLTPVHIPLPVRPTVGVARGPLPVTGARVRFTADAAGGTVDGGTVPVTTTTAADGTASVAWSLAPAAPVQRLTAVLLGADGNPTSLPVHFTARLRTADAVAYGPGACDDLAAARTVQEALDTLCRRRDHGGCCASVGKDGEFEDIGSALEAMAKRHEGRVCLCLLPGDHEYEADVPEGLRSLSLHGAGARVHLRRPFHVAWADALLVREIELVDGGELGVLLELHGCRRVLVDGVTVRASGVSAESTLVRLLGCDEVRIANSTLLARAMELDDQERPDLGEGAAKIIELASHEPTPEELEAFVADFFSQPPSDLEAAAETLTAFIDNAPGISHREHAVLLRLVRFILNGQAPERPEVRRQFASFGQLTNLLDGRASFPGPAVEIEDGDGEVWLENNSISGGVSAYGRVPPDFYPALEQDIETHIRTAHDNPPTLQLSGGRLHVVDNALAWLAFPGDARKHRCFAQAVITGNLVRPGPVLVAAGAVIAQGNTLLPMRRVAGSLWADAATATGNIAGNEALLVLVAEPRASAANIMSVLP